MCKVGIWANYDKKSIDLNKRETLVKAICTEAKYAFLNFCKYDDTEIANKVKDYIARYDVAYVVLFLHYSDMKSLNTVTWAFCDNVYAIFYSGEGVDNKPQNDNIKMLNTAFPGEIAKGKYRFKRIVDLLGVIDVFESGKAFRDVDINDQAPTPELMMIWKELDIILQGILQKQTEPKDIQSIFKDVAKKLSKYPKFDRLEEQIFSYLPKSQITQINAHLNTSPFSKIHNALTEETYDIDSLLIENNIEQATKDFNDTLQELCESQEL